MTQQNNNSLVELIKSLPIPDIIKNNAITALSKGIGKIISSAADLPVAYFETQSKIIKAKGEGKVKLINTGAESASNLLSSNSELAERALQYFGDKIIKQQINRERVAAKTIENLKDPIEDYGKITKEIDEDWLTQFWNLSETKTKDDVQVILSKILAKEIVNPGSISPYTLQLLSVLTSDIGNSFNRLCNLSFEDSQSCYVIHPNVFAFQNIGPLGDYDISYEDLFDLDGAGLIRSAETLLVNYGENQTRKFEQVNYAGRNINIDVSGKQLHILQLTKSGRELRNLLPLIENKNYTTKIKNLLKDSIQFGDSGE